jgi:peptidoglycan glycosyltransferase
MPHRLQRLLLLFFIGYAAVALTVLYWGVWRGEELLVREDNPRTVEAELRVVRGQILDRNGVVLAESVVNPLSGRVTRRYPIPDVGAAVGYYSLRYGTAGVEQAHDAPLRGQTTDTLAVAWQKLLNSPPTAAMCA